MTPPLSPLGVVVGPSPIEGLGVFAAQAFALGTRLLVVDDTHPASAAPSHQEARFHDFLEADRVVIMQAPERHINHSCQPNTAILTHDGVRELRAIRPIQPGDEITTDYSINGSGNTVWQCLCGAARCRRDVHSDFFHLPFDLQREYLPLLDTWFQAERASEIRALHTALHTHSNSSQGHTHASRS